MGLLACRTKGWHFHFWCLVLALCPPYGIYLFGEHIRRDMESQDIVKADFFNGLEGRLISDPTYQMTPDEESKVGDTMARQKFLENVFSKKLIELESRFFHIESKINNSDNHMEKSIRIYNLAISFETIRNGVETIKNEAVYLKTNDTYLEKFRQYIRF